MFVPALGLGAISTKLSRQGASVGTTEGASVTPKNISSLVAGSGKPNETAPWAQQEAALLGELGHGLS